MCDPYKIGGTHVNFNQLKKCVEKYAMIAYLLKQNTHKKKKTSP